GAARRRPYRWARGRRCRSSGDPSAISPILRAIPALPGGPGSCLAPSRPINERRWLMQRHLVVTVGIALAAALAAASGCGTDSGAPPGSTAAAGEAMSPRDVDHSYRIQPEPHGSVVAQCSGFSLIPLEAGMPGVRVGALDLSELGRDERLVKAVREAPPGELVLFGTVRAPDSTLVVREVYRGMPGVSAAEGDAFYQVAPRDPRIECFAAPCDNLVATPLSGGGPTYFTTLSVASAGAMPSVDRTWLADRVLHHGAIV